jgi:hypothetical protein
MENRPKKLHVLDLNGALLSGLKSRDGFYTRPHFQSFLNYIFSICSYSVELSYGCRQDDQDVRKSQIALIWSQEALNLSNEEFNTNTKVVKIWI